MGMGWSISSECHKPTLNKVVNIAGMTAPITNIGVVNIVGMILIP